MTPASIGGGGILVDLPPLAAVDCGLLVVTEFPTDGALLRVDGAWAAGAGLFFGAAFTGTGFFCGAAFAAAGFFLAAFAGAAFAGAAFFAGTDFLADTGFTAFAGAFLDAAAGFFTALAAALDFATALRAAPSADRAGGLPDFARLPATGLLFAIPNSIL